MTENGQERISLSKTLILGLSIFFLIFIWHRNYNLLGSFYDYSILTAADGYLQSGLLPYRDFTTPLQSLPIYLCNAAEGVFGRRYLSLAYANLAIGLLFFLILLRMLRSSLFFYQRLLVSLALVVCTFFQHGILWYNSLGILFLSLIAIKSAGLLRKGDIHFSDAAALCVLAFLSSMVKMNFHALGMGIAGLALVALFWIQKANRRIVIATALVLGVSGTVLGPVTEIIVNRTTLHDFVENVVRTPSGRGIQLFNLLNPSLYLGKVNDYYPDNWSSGTFLLACLVYAGCAWVVASAPNPIPGFKLSAADYCALGGLLVFLAGGILLIVTNIETQMLTASFLILGPVCALLVRGHPSSSESQLPFKFAIFLLSGFFFIAGSASGFMHSRLRYNEPSWTGAMESVFRKEKRLSALKHVLPFYEAEAISPKLQPYFTGVRFTEPARDKLQKILAFMAGAHQGQNAGDVYWGPGLEIMNRVYGTRLQARLPLWYHPKVTIRQQDAPRIIAELQRAHYEWIVSTDFIESLPQPILDYLQADYQRIEADEITVYQARH